MALYTSATESDQQQQQSMHVARARQAAEWMSAHEDGINNHIPICCFQMLAPHLTPGHFTSLHFHITTGHQAV